MSARNFWITYVLLTICQAVICNYCNFSPLVTVSILPAMVVCIPHTVRTPWAMVIAFLTGLAVDFTSDAVIGLNALALVPVAFVRTGLLRLFLGNDVTEKKDSLNIKTKGLAKVSGICLTAVAIFHIVYIAADGAGTRPFLLNLIHFVISVIISYLLSLVIVSIFSPKAKAA
ncbi:MAG: hypothetical protein LUC24_03005 [Bacteroidales bacterium]|nr:hypothetical protein [Bacteroidales bacterium]